MLDGILFTFTCMSGGGVMAVYIVDGKKCKGVHYINFVLLIDQLRPIPFHY